MIKTLADLLDDLRQKEITALADYRDLEHGPMIGDIYEGLTRDLLTRTLLDGLDLRVVEGKITNEAGKLSRQIDAMIVVGDGERVPHTDHFIYPLPQVIAVVEVKKTLFGEDIGDAYDNLLSVGDLHTPRPVPMKRLRSAYCDYRRQQAWGISPTITTRAWSAVVRRSPGH